ncbi:protein ROOT PRIMORDIUM DEFECTIVE 1-like [Melia azedarach]|uniref:Protein ROOT PRIMORDIUM DEFECTIVE 1-like n=1 Tax=Melia azedarach TaxID=155640 RepID=A0ACC1X629_MELAZ|nr:protein ROOT PRIMORDIUM DEFECTIVE 1-like [Melia azedarach]
MFALKSLRNHNYSLFQKIPFVEQRRWKKAVDSAQTRLENRTRDHKLDKLATRLRTLRIILNIRQLMSARKRGPFVSVQLMSRWKNIVGLNINIGKFLHKYPHVFQVLTHPLKKNLCSRFTPKMKLLINGEENVVRRCELDAVNRLKKLLMMSKNGTLHVHALRLVRKELGLPEDFRESILEKYANDFRLVDLEIVELVNRDENLGDAVVEIWRENEYKEKWLSEFEIKYAFPINFPTGFKIEEGFKDKLKNWQRLPYIKPYEKKENVVRVRTCGGIERFEKRAVAIIHELLNLTVEKRVEVERLSHFRKDFAMEVNVRELLLRHPGIFYISTKGSTQTVFLREAYSKGFLIEPNPIYVIRRKMLELVLLGCRNTRELKNQVEKKELSDNLAGEVDDVATRDGDWVIPMLGSSELGN